MADRKPTHGKPGTKSKGAPERRLSKNDLDRMVEEAVVDAYGESEQITAFFTMLEDNLALPFDAVVLGVDIKVEKLDLTDDEQIVFVCRRGRERLTLDIRELPLPEPPPNGWKWFW
ncbi:calcium-binding protein [Acidobacteria bacterium AH-259-O06]|nr:calcium-binding protein [Acidobacteria bacterium AH-259-O06]